MGIYVEYTVRCTGGGWLVAGRPMICHRIQTRFTTIAQAHHTALGVGWVSDPERKTHTCPQHQEEPRPNGPQCLGVE